MKKEELIALGIDEEVAKSVMALHGKTVTQLNAQLTAVENERDNAQETIKTLEDKTKDNPEVQAELDTYKTKATNLEVENKQLKINQQVSTALQQAGAKDIEYATFKLGELELDKDGNVKDLANKVKDLQSNLPDYFAKSEDTKPVDPLDKFQTLNPEAKDGKQTKSFSVEEVQKMTPEQINENWDAVSATLENGGNE